MFILLLQVCLCTTIANNTFHSHGSVRRLEWRKYSCHAGEKYTLRVGVVMDRGFFARCGGSESSCSRVVDEIFARASVPFRHNFGIVLTAAKIFFPENRRGNLFDDVPADSEETLGRGESGVFACPSGLDIDARRVALDNWSAQQPQKFGV